MRIQYIAFFTALAALLSLVAATAADTHDPVDAALNACAATAPKDSHGGPDRGVMRACMEKKGFAPPEGGPGEPGGPPPGGADEGSREE